MSGSLLSISLNGRHVRTVATIWIIQQSQEPFSIISCLPNIAEIRRLVGHGPACSLSY
jgi:hypothetical protein